MRAGPLGSRRLTSHVLSLPACALGLAGRGVPAPLGARTLARIRRSLRRWAGLGRRTARWRPATHLCDHIGRHHRRALLALGTLDVRASLPDRRRLTDRGRLADVGFADRLTLPLSRFPLGPLLGQIAGHEVRIHGKNPYVIRLGKPLCTQFRAGISA